jgi:hypothetical protein
MKIHKKMINDTEGSYDVFEENGYQYLFTAEGVCLNEEFPLNNITKEDIPSILYMYRCKTTTISPKEEVEVGFTEIDSEGNEYVTLSTRDRISNIINKLLNIPFLQPERRARLETILTLQIEKALDKGLSFETIESIMEDVVSKSCITEDYVYLQEMYKILQND